MLKKIIYNRICIIIQCAIIYFVLDYFLRITNFFRFGSFLGLKTFLHMTFGLIYGIYGVIGSLISLFFTTFLIYSPINSTIIEAIIIIIVGIGSWFLWHLSSSTHTIRFKYVREYIRFFIISIILYGISGIFGLYIISFDALKNIFNIGVSMSMLVAIPILIIYNGLMSLKPILPPIYIDGKHIEIKNEIVYVLTSDKMSISKLNDLLENYYLPDRTTMKKILEIQNLIEEIYLRIIKYSNEYEIFVYANCDISFSVEFTYEGHKYNPFYANKNEDELDVIGLKLIKERALLVRYNYILGENKIHIVM